MTSQKMWKLEYYNLFSYYFLSTFHFNFYIGIGPAYAIPVALEKAGLKVEDIGIYELNEAFATQAIYCAKKLGIPQDKINPKGGAIACGHPLGCTGARIMATLLPELKRSG